MLQVVVLGHGLSTKTHEYLRSQGPYKVFKTVFHIERFDQVFEAVEEVFQDLQAQGCDLSGQTPTVFQATGSSVGAMAIVAAWYGLTGHLPSILNLIRQWDNSYGPSPEMPQLDLDGFAESFPDGIVHLDGLRTDTRRKLRVKYAMGEAA